MTYDPFEPRREPHKTIYRSLAAETEKRRNGGDWETAERQNAWRTARDYAQQNGLRVPTMADIERAERMAMGHSDYLMQWTCGIAEAMRNSVPEQRSSE